MSDLIYNAWCPRGRPVESFLQDPRIPGQLTLRLRPNSIVLFVDTLFKRAPYLIYHNI